jgi:uncharacterized protein
MSFIRPMLVLLLCAVLPQIFAQVDLPQPGYNEFVIDNANLLSPEAEQEIVTIARNSDAEFGTPIVVVTIDRMSEHSSYSEIEVFATVLFNQWGIGYENINGQEHNTGILLLVSKEDRKARIELGASWGRDQDDQARYIMHELIIPRFKENGFEQGILDGVAGLDAIVQKKPLPSPPISFGAIAAIIIFIGLMIFTIVSLIRRGSSGWAWLFWGAVFVFVGFTLRAWLRSNSGSSWSGGGGFGGGFSGGGGASGSW